METFDRCSMDETKISFSDKSIAGTCHPLRTSQTYGNHLSNWYTLLHHREIGIDLFWIDNIDSAAPPSSSLSKCRSIWEEWIRLLARLKRNDDPFTSYFFSHGSFTDDHEISKRPVIRWSTGFSIIWNHRIRTRSSAIGNSGVVVGS
jgi:hypothetical protein